MGVRRLSVRKKITSTIVKSQRKYYYNRRVLKKLRFSSKRMMKKAKMIKMKRKEQFLDLKSVAAITEQTLLNSILDKKINADCEVDMEKPFLVSEVNIPHITMPQILDVALHKGNKIDYTDNTLYYRVSSDQLIEQMALYATEKNKEAKSDRFSLSVPQMELKDSQYTVPELVSKIMGTIHKVNLWMYSGQRQTQWHYDGHDNLLYVLAGQKVVYLAHPSSISSNYVFSLFNNHANPNKQVNCSLQKAIIQRGSCLYIPKGWWHRVYSYGMPSMAVNYWGNSIKNFLEQLSDTQKSLVLKSLLFQISEKYCARLVPTWESLKQVEKQIVRSNAGIGILGEGKWIWK